MASDLVQEIRKAADAVRARTQIRPEVGIILGTGLGDSAEGIATETVIPYSEIPGFPVSTVQGHAGELHLGTLAGRPVAVMRGRTHYYEGYTMRQVTFPVRVLKELGCGTLVITNACGGMNPDMPPGTIVAVSDHINLMGDNPLIGPNDDELGDRFPDMSEPYSRALIGLAEKVALEQKWILQRAVFVAVAGPNLETAAEYRFLRGIGADVVGMALIPENIVAVHGRQRVLALSVVTDECLPDDLQPADIPGILRVARETSPRLLRLVTEVIRRIDEAA